jgi:4-hydroxy-tetrahydrodipicolinate synthase
VKIDFKGIIPPVVTPFTQDEKEIAENDFRKIIRYIVGNGCSGVFVGGSQGEFFSMSDEERIKSYEIAVDEASGKFPVFAGTGAISTAQAVKLTKAAERAGASAVSVVNPFFIRLNEEEMYGYYSDIAKSVDIPILLYNNPDRTGANIPVSVIKKLSQIDNIIGMKDSGGDLTYVNSILNLQGDFKVFCGKDTCIFNELISGASGAVAASANVAPKLVSGIYNSVKEGNIEQAKKLQVELFPLRDAFSLGSFPVVVKEALTLIGYNAGPARKPIKPMTDENRDKLRIILKNMKLL